MKAEELWTPKTYDRFSRVYDLVERLFPFGEKGHRRVVGDLREGSLLDVGCGTGSVLALACANGLVPCGIDTSDGMLGRARSKAPKAMLAKASFYHVPYPADCFDTVVETHAVGGVGFDVPAILAEMLRVCRPGGEVRLADYGPPLRETVYTRLIRAIFRLLGDEPTDFAGMFRALGCEPQVEHLAWGGMYQVIRVQKP